MTAMPGNAFSLHLVSGCLIVLLAGMDDEQICSPGKVRQPNSCLAGACGRIHQRTSPPLDTADAKGAAELAVKAAGVQRAQYG